MRHNSKFWTYGAELEFGDVDRNKPPVEGCGWDVRDFTMMNSNGVAVDPKGVMYRYGGEINTAPTETVDDQVKLFGRILQHYPEASINHRSNLHIHIRAPRLREDLQSLKKVQKFIHHELREIIDLVEPIPHPTRREHPIEVEYLGAMRRYRRRGVSHHTFLTEPRLQYQLEATSVEEFFEREVPHTKKDNKPMWHAQPRLCVNLRQLRETDTIEFRHFPLTLCPKEFRNALCWCRDFLIRAVEGLPLGVAPSPLPKFPPYVHWMEERYRLTCHDGSVPKDQIRKNIERFLDEDSRNVSGKRK